jgi:peptide/nickel transport system permease protein
MLRYAARRLLLLPVTLSLIALGGFAMVQLLPGDPVSARTDLAEARHLSAESIARLRATYGLDLPAFYNGSPRGEGTAAHFLETRFGTWMGRLLTLDFGESHEGRSVSSLLAEAMPVTLLIGLCALLSAYAVALPLGALTAARAGGRLDRASLGVTLVMLSLPAPWVAVSLVSLVGALPVDLLPLQGLHSVGSEEWSFLARAADLLWHLLLPVSCLAYGTAALLLRYQRGAVLATLAEPFIQAARAKGLSERSVLFRHALRASLGPAIALLSVEIPWVLSGSVVVESAFDLPGMGLLVGRALQSRDYPVLLGAVMVLAAVSSLASLGADLLSAWIDPRFALRRAR